MKLISNQINPHFTLRDSLHAVGCLLGGKTEMELNSIFEQKFCTKNFILTNAARTALGLMADVVQPDKTKKIGLPAFICAVVATPFLARGYQIEWIDVDPNGVIDVADFAAKASGISLLVAPHIFGQTAPLAGLMPIARAHKIFVVEDSAHFIPQLEGSAETLADAQILSFGREKVIGCVSGGALLWPADSPYAKKFRQTEQALPQATATWTIRHALQPLWFSLALPWWQAGGKLIPWLARQLRLLPLAVTAAEKQGREDFPATKLPLPQQRILGRQLALYPQRQAHAKQIATAWQKALPSESLIIPSNKFRVIVNPTSQNLKFKIQNSKFLHLREWDGVPISPKGVDLAAFGYQAGQCPQAEALAKNHQTFPTNQRVDLSSIKRFAKLIGDS